MIQAETDGQRVSRIAKEASEIFVKTISDIRELRQSHRETIQRIDKILNPYPFTFHDDLLSIDKDTSALETCKGDGDQMSEKSTAKSPVRTEKKKSVKKSLKKESKEEKSRENKSKDDKYKEVKSKDDKSKDEKSKELLKKSTKLKIQAKAPKTIDSSSQKNTQKVNAKPKISSSDSNAKKQPKSNSKKASHVSTTQQSGQQSAELVGKSKILRQHKNSLR